MGCWNPDRGYSGNNNSNDNNNFKNSNKDGDEWTDKVPVDSASHLELESVKNREDNIKKSLRSLFSIPRAQWGCNSCTNKMYLLKKMHIFVFLHCLQHQGKFPHLLRRQQAQSRWKELPRVCCNWFGFHPSGRTSPAHVTAVPSVLATPPSPSYKSPTSGTEEMLINL